MVTVSGEYKTKPKSSLGGKSTNVGTWLCFTGSIRTPHNAGYDKNWLFCDVSNFDDAHDYCVF